MDLSGYRKYLPALIAPLVWWVACGRDSIYTRNPCEGVTCDGHGVCSLNADGDAVCTCEPGYRNLDPTSCVPDVIDNEPCQGQDWYWQNPLPTGHWLNAVWGTNSNNVWAVGDFGTILHLDGLNINGILYPLFISNKLLSNLMS